VGQAVPPAEFIMDYRRRLPHIHPDGARIFLTWRLWNTLPVKHDRIGLTAGKVFTSMDRALNTHPGPRWLEDPRIAQIVANAIRDGAQRGMYELDAWVIMPNHVHILILPIIPVPKITRFLKSWTARQANAILHRTGQPFWQDESFDHWIRTVDQRNRVMDYIEDNPITAGLTGVREHWQWSSARTLA
jgi:REP element-mobilizing transposase RayT